MNYLNMLKTIKRINPIKVVNNVTECGAQLIEIYYLKFTKNKN